MLRRTVTAYFLHVFDKPGTRDRWVYYRWATYGCSDGSVEPEGADGIETGDFGTNEVKYPPSTQLPASKRCQECRQTRPIWLFATARGVDEVSKRCVPCIRR